MWRFVRAHLGWLWLAPVVVLYGTVLHELTHCAAAVLSGGTVTELHVLPTWLAGHFVFGFMEATGHDVAWTKVAPPLLSACVATFGYAWLGELKPGRAAKACFVFFYLLPLFDVSMAVTGAALRVQITDLWVLADHLGALEVAALVFFALHLWNVPRLFRDENLTPNQVRLLTALFLLSPVLRFL
jgi:hypothetical protein